MAEAATGSSAPTSGHQRPPIILKTLAPGAPRPRYGRWALMSVVAHAALLVLFVQLVGSVPALRPEPVAVFLRGLPRPGHRHHDGEEGSKPRKGSRGVTLAKAVPAPIEPEAELSFAPAVGLSAPQRGAGLWFGGTGEGAGRGPGRADGSDESAVVRVSLARGPREELTGWDCGFPEDGPPHNVVVRIRISVSATGRPTQVQILVPGPPSFNASARECALRQRFHPAVDMRGKPCEGERELGILFLYPGEAISEGPVTSR